jgi:hypothetical protein
LFCCYLGLYIVELVYRKSCTQTLVGGRGVRTACICCCCYCCQCCRPLSSTHCSDWACCAAASPPCCVCFACALSLSLSVSVSLSVAVGKISRGGARPFQGSNRRQRDGSAGFRFSVSRFPALLRRVTPQLWIARLVSLTGHEFHFNTSVKPGAATTSERHIPKYRAKQRGQYG